MLLERDLDFERDGERLESEADLERSTEDLDEWVWEECALLTDGDRLFRDLRLSLTGEPERLLDLTEQGLCENFLEFGVLCVLVQSEFVCKIGMRVLSIISTGDWLWDLWGKSIVFAHTSPWLAMSRIATEYFATISPLPSDSALWLLGELWDSSLPEDDELWLKSNTKSDLWESY